MEHGKHTNYCLGMDEMTAIRMVEVCDAFTRKLQMLLLVMSDWHMSCPCNTHQSLFACLLRTAAPLLREGGSFCQAYRWTRISAAWSTGYENKPSFSLDPTDLFSSVEDEARLSLL